MESGAHHDAARLRQFRFESDSSLQQFPVPAAMAVASSGVGGGKDSPIQWQLKEKKAAWRRRSRDRRRPRPWTAGCNMAEPYTLIEAAQPLSALARRRARREPKATKEGAKRTTHAPFGERSRPQLARQTLAAAVPAFQPKAVIPFGRQPSRDCLAQRKGNCLMASGNRNDSLWLLARS